MSERAPRKPWSRLEKWLLGGSAVAVLAIGLVAWSRMDDGPDLPDCPSVSRATRRLEDARRRRDRAGEREAIASLAGGWLCRHAEDDAAGLRVFLANFDLPPTLLEGSVLAVARLVDSERFPPRPVPPPEQRTGSAGERTMHYLRDAFSGDGHALPPQASATLQLGAGRALVLTADVASEDTDFVLFERLAGTWRRTGAFSTAGSGLPAVAWIDPDLRLVVLSSSWKAAPNARIVDLAAGFPTLAELPGKYVLYKPDGEGPRVLQSWAPPAPLREGALRYEMALSRSDAGLRIDLALRTIGKKALFEALDGGLETRRQAAASQEIAEFLGTLALRDVHSEVPPDTIDVSCDKTCPKGTCHLLYQWVDHTFRVTAVTGPAGCDPLHPTSF